MCFYRIFLSLEEILKCHKALTYDTEYFFTVVLFTVLSVKMAPTSWLVRRYRSLVCLLWIVLYFSEVAMGIQLFFRDYCGIGILEIDSDNYSFLRPILFSEWMELVQETFGRRRKVKKEMRPLSEMF